MTKETEYAICLRHVVKFLVDSADGRPVQNDYAVRVGNMCQLVLDGKTTEQAIKEVHQ